MMSEPRVFISYSWDSEEHKSWVRHLAEILQENGVRVLLDQWDTYPGMDLPRYMETSVREADFVLLICTPHFARKANSASGGVGYEKIIVTGEIFEGSTSQKKFVPIIRKGQPKESLPSYLKSKVYIDFSNDSKFEKSLEKTLRHLHHIPEYIPPQIGSKPSFTSTQKSTPVYDKKVADTQDKVGLTDEHPIDRQMLRKRILDLIDNCPAEVFKNQSAGIVMFKDYTVAYVNDIYNHQYEGVVSEVKFSQMFKWYSAIPDQKEGRREIYMPFRYDFADDAVPWLLTVKRKR